jgi:hypothetical protein
MTEVKEDAIKEVTNSGLTIENKTGSLYEASKRRNKKK